MSEFELGPGIHDGLPATTYHADPCEQPSLTASTIKLLCAQSPRHAWEHHPRLNPNYKRVDEQKFDVGTVAHALLLDGEDRCTIVEAADWRTKDAKKARDEARENGRIPLLPDQYNRVQDMITAIRWQLEAVTAAPPLLADGKPEQTLIWQEAGVTCRARADWLHNDHTAIDDLKTTGASANPFDYERQLWNMGGDIQAALYMRGVKALTGTTPEFRFLVIENTPPYALSVISLAPAALALANEKVNWAISTWRECLQRDVWPGYAPRVVHAEGPVWESTRWSDARQYDDMEASAA